MMQIGLYYPDIKLVEQRAKAIPDEKLPPNPHTTTSTISIGVCISARPRAPRDGNTSSFCLSTIP